jgi:hypothetical protein
LPTGVPGRTPPAQSRMDATPAIDLKKKIFRKMA